MITSPHNEKLKLIRKPRQAAKHREREGLFVGRGRGPARRGAAAGRRARRAADRGRAGPRRDEVEPELLDRVSTLGSGTRAIGVWRQAWAEPAGRPASTCTASPTRGTSARHPHGARPGRRHGRARPGLRRPLLGPKAVRAEHGRGLRRAAARAAAIDATPSPRAALVAHGGEPLDALDGARRRSASAPSATGCPPTWSTRCDAHVDDPAARGAPSR